MNYRIDTLYLFDSFDTQDNLLIDAYYKYVKKQSRVLSCCKVYENSLLKPNKFKYITIIYDTGQRRNVKLNEIKYIVKGWCK